MTPDAIRGLSRFATRWPERRDEMLTLARRSSLVCELCEAYELAHHAVASFSVEPGEGAKEVVADYRSIISDLEADMIRSLKEMPKSSLH